MLNIAITFIESPVCNVRLLDHRVCVWVWVCVCARACMLTHTLASVLEEREKLGLTFPIPSILIMTAKQDYAV